MTEYSSAKQQYKILQDQLDDLKNAYGRFIAEWILSLPIGINYEFWRYLHRVVGDYE